MLFIWKHHETEAQSFVIAALEVKMMKWTACFYHPSTSEFLQQSLVTKWEFNIQDPFWDLMKYRRHEEKGLQNCNYLLLFLWSKHHQEDYFSRGTVWDMKYISNTWLQLIGPRDTNSSKPSSESLHRMSHSIPDHAHLRRELCSCFSFSSIQHVLYASVILRSDCAPN